MTKTFEEKIERINKEIERESEKIRMKKEEKKRLQKLKNQEKRKRENHEKYKIGGMVRSIFKEKNENEIREEIEKLLYIKNQIKDFLHIPSDKDLVDFLSERSNIIE